MLPKIALLHDKLRKKTNMKTRKSKEETKTKQMQIVFPRVITQRLDVDVGKTMKLDR